MRLEKQTALVHVEGRSEKVYEVDLCQVGEGRFVVNFRYGKRGAALKEGSKTPVPTLRAEAERIFDKLVDQKIEQGYQRALPGMPSPRGSAAPPPVDLSRVLSRGLSRGKGERERRVLERLAQPEPRGWGRRGGATWKLERAIWRAGEMGLAEAEPLLLRLLGSASGKEEGGRGARDYAIAWALGRLGSEASFEPLAALFRDARAPEHVRRMAGEALRALSDEATRAEMAKDLVLELPEPLRGPAGGDSAEAFSEALLAWLDGLDGDPARASVLETLYAIDSPVVRPALLASLSRSYRSPLFRVVRRILKAAEFRRDGEVFGLVAYRIEKEKGRGPQTWEERRRGTPAVYTAATRQYLRRRAARTLRRLGELGDPDYLKMAVGALLPFKDSDAVPPRRGYGYGSGRVEYGPFAPYLALNQVLFGGSRRLELSPSGKCWRTKPRAAARDAGQGGEREEGFPALWEARPEGLVHLLVESDAAPVHEFAARALSALPGFLASLDDEVVALFLGRPYEPTAKLGFELARQRRAERRLSRPVLLALARSAYAPGRGEALRWIDEDRPSLAEDAAFVAGLALAPFSDARRAARSLLRGARLRDETADAILGRIFAGLLALGDSPEEAALAGDAAETVLVALGERLARIGAPALCDLLAHPLAGVQELGAEILLRRDARSGLLPEELILQVVRSRHAGVRALGLRLVAELPDDVLALADRLLSRLAADGNPDVRAASRPLVRRALAADPEAASRLAASMAEALLRRRLPEGTPAFLLDVLGIELLPGALALPEETVFRLLRSGSPEALLLGARLLPPLLEGDRLEVEELVELAGHELLAVRCAAWDAFERRAPRLRARLPAAVRVLDVRWDDTREWAKRFFRERFSPEDFTLEVLVGIIDSARDDMQAFGREMAARAFRESEAPELLLRVSEHPSRGVELFATNYLERFASGDPERLTALLPYFRTVLSRVNAGRTAKERVARFLEAEVQKHEASARALLPLLEVLSAAKSIELREAVLSIAVLAKRAHPDLPLPASIRIVTPEVRRAL